MSRTAKIIKLTILFKEGKEEARKDSDLTNPEDKHPADKVGFNLCKPAFKLLFHKGD